jgi:hypothetical protein
MRSYAFCNTYVTKFTGIVGSADWAGWPGGRIGRDRGLGAGHCDPHSQLGDFCTPAAIPAVRAQMDTPFYLRFCSRGKFAGVRFLTVADRHFVAVPLSCDDSTSARIGSVQKSPNCEPRLPRREQAGDRVVFPVVPSASFLPVTR